MGTEGYGGHDVGLMKTQVEKVRPKIVWTSQLKFLDARTYQGLFSDWKKKRFSKTVGFH